MPPRKPGAQERDGSRHVFDAPVSAAWGPTVVAVLNASEHGLQIEHPEPFKVSSVSRITISLPASSHKIELDGQIAWTQLSRAGDRKGVFVYRSGVKLDGTAENMAMMRMIIAAYPGRPDQGAPERRGDNQPVMRLIKTPQRVVDPDRLLLIRQINERLSLAPEEMKTLAARARSALSIRVASVINTDNELAVWEYLQRVVSLDDIHDALA